MSTQEGLVGAPVPTAATSSDEDLVEVTGLSATTEDGLPNGQVPPVPPVTSTNEGLAVVPLLPGRQLRTLQLVIWGCALAMFLVLCIIAVHEYNRFELSQDYSIFNQADFKITHGQLYPYNTIFSKAFMVDHGAFMVYLQAPFYFLGGSHGGLVLQFLQAAGLAGSVVMAARVLLYGLTERRAAPGVVYCCVGLLLVSCLANPWIYAVAFEDVHYEALGTLFSLALIYDLYTGHSRRAWIWVVLVASIGDVGGTYIVGLGLGAVLFLPRQRRQGGIMAAAGLAWVVVLGLLHADTGSLLPTFAYITGRPIKGNEGAHALFRLIGGLVTHPGRALHRLHLNDHRVANDILPTGVIGLLDPLVGPVALVVLLTGAVSADTGLSVYPFQNCLLYFFIPLGTALLVGRFPWGSLAAAARAGWLRRAVVWPVLVSAVLVVSMLAFDLPRDRKGAFHHYYVSPAAAADLTYILSRTPQADEVVSSFGVVGRFSARDWIYDISKKKDPEPVKAKTVEFVLAPWAGNAAEVPATTLAIERYVVAKLHATAMPMPVALRGGGVKAYVWHPKRVGGKVILP
jgi:Predicted membrane protein (DUF2079)